jgi:lysozyme family protein
MESKEINAIIDAIIRREGGYVNDPNDPGGATKYGLSLRQAKIVGDRNGDGWQDFDLDHDGDVDPKDIQLLDIDLVRYYFLDKYFSEPNFDALPDGLVPLIFDMSVNLGARETTIILQRTLRKWGFHLQLDGDCGAETITCACSAFQDDPKKLINKITTERILFYHNLALEKTGLNKFFSGWLNRSLEFFKTSGE